jgi:hypothetical protein
MNHPLSLRSLNLDPNTIERRKQLTRDLWAGKALNHDPGEAVETYRAIMEFMTPGALERPRGGLPPNEGDCR